MSKKVYEEVKWEPATSDQCIPWALWKGDSRALWALCAMARGPMILFAFGHVVLQQDKSVSTKKQTERGRPWDRELPTPRFLEQIFKSTGPEETRFRSYILARP